MPRNVKELTDASACFIKLPESTRFVESVAYNKTFDADSIYIPLQNENKELEIYKAPIPRTSPPNPVDIPSTKLCGPISLEGSSLGSKFSAEENTELTPFGSALDTTGRLWICVFNRNAVIAVQLPSGSLLHAVQVPAPNDLSIDPSNELCVYAACGSTTEILGQKFPDATAGRVWKVEVGNEGAGSATRVTRMRTNTLAGVEVVGSKLYVSQLYNLLEMSKGGWYKHAVWDGADGKGDVWLADNVRIWDEKTIIFPSYRVLPEAVASKVLKTGCISMFGNCLGQLYSARREGENWLDALKNPEMALELSTNDSDHPILISLMDAQTKQERNFKVKLESSHAKPGTNGRKFYFDGNVTHATHAGPHVILVNFQQPRIMVLPDSMFK